MGPQSIFIEGKRFVLIPEGEYERLKAVVSGLDESALPALPQALPDGNYPAVEYARASLARKLILARRAARLTQGELAKQAGVRLETISRIERARHTADPATIDKLERAIKATHVPKNGRRKAV